ncbi:hypothetical protein AO284_04790 [Pseudomonas sp. NZIPFR-PS2]|uniref:Uncharacterized protein n=1 Tax=Pseudomonas simiae TaxID=321846 RepID=A0A1N7UG35_9PSED|nr:hypothetical protein PS417_04410 [Pseudomonas simiae]PHX42434.1 hypothetical protein AO284_04790 [Pseudomonas sp. NZIPFR-PS2]TKK05013.1 hypothetical protein PflCFBP13514_11555 [Pseudomonas fluorescens]AJZ96956.1 hypothetical protein PFLUOLIPICF7_03825 [Pseudomonas simiae]ERH58533.1 hypothetical protein O204_02960 [Pseudomonas simiae]
MLAKDLNDNVFIQNQRGVHEFFASKLAATNTDLFQIEAVMASICVRRRLRSDSNSLMKD